MWIQYPDRQNDSTEWKLVWEDDFKDSQLDTSRWSMIGLYTSERLMEAFPEVQQNRNGWRKITNHWASYASAKNPKAVVFDGENLLLNGVFNPDTTGSDNRPYHTGGIWTYKKFAFQYGRLEVRAKLDPAYGAWPAIWMIPQNKIYPEQHNGEMDLMERLNHDTFVYQTIHKAPSKSRSNF